MLRFIVFLLFCSQAINAQNYVDIVESVMPSVVNISGIGEKIITKNKKTKKQKINNIGAGFIVTTDGYCVTNYHILENIKDVTVETFDHKIYNAKIIGHDPKLDITVLKIESNEVFKPVVIGSSKDVKVGENVIAIGNPFGFGHSVSAGIISGKSRYIKNLGEYFLQTDAAINNGNSGGPLFNDRGEVIGVNNLMLNKDSNVGNIGLSFAIPIDLAMIIVEKIKNNVKILRPSIGVFYNSVTDEIALSTKLNKKTGVFVYGVEKKSAAEKAGIKTGDIILSINNEVINLDNSLPSVLLKMQIGQKMTFKIWRFEKQIKIDVVAQ